jgi:hypothetical protein
LPFRRLFKNKKKDSFCHLFISWNWKKKIKEKARPTCGKNVEIPPQKTTNLRPKSFPPFPLFALTLPKKTLLLLSYPARVQCIMVFFFLLEEIRQFLYWTEPGEKKKDKKRTKSD